MLISPKKLEGALNKLKSGKGSPDQITADVLKAVLPECLEKLARSLSVVCWGMSFLEDWLCSLAPKVVGATCLTKFKPIAGLCAMLKILGYVWHMSLLPPIRVCADGVCAENACRCSPIVVVVTSCRIVERMAERNCGGTTAREESVHRAAFKATRLQGVSPFSMALIAAV